MKQWLPRWLKGWTSHTRPQTSPVEGLKPPKMRGGLGDLPDKETCWRRRWGGKEQGSRSQAAGNCRSQRRGGDYLCCKFVLVRVSSYLGRGARLGEEPPSLALLQTILLLPRNLPGPGPSLGGRQMSGLCKLYFSPNTKETILPRLATEN